VKFFIPAVLLGAALVLSSCGGASSRLGQVSGVVVDANNNPVRNARVWAGGGGTQTATNAAGIYVLEGVPRGDVVIRAEIVQNGIRFLGSNVARVFEQERNKSVNIMVSRANQQGTLRGVVQDRVGNRLQNARVFAIGTGYSSSMAITDASGEFTISNLMSGLDYQVTASARTYTSDTDFINLAINETRFMTFVLGDGINPTLPAPQNLTAISWTTHRYGSRSPDAATYEAIKNMIDPRRANRKATSRVTALGNPVEVDLYWDSIDSSGLLGFGIYRGTTPSGLLTPIDFLRDPLAEFFADLDDQLQVGVPYYYEVTALNVQYPDFQPGSESAPSNRYGVIPLGDLLLLPMLQQPPTFRWQALPRAESYVVFVFDRFPGVGVQSIWSNSGNPTTGTSLIYTGPRVPGQRYYYIVLALADEGDSRALSVIGEFVG
jgi:hypothetical protein